MDVQVSHSAHISVEGGSASISLSTFYFGGFWKWSGVLLNTVAHDEWGCRLFETVEGVDCGLSFFDNSEDAIAHAVAQFDGTEEDGPSPAFTGKTGAQLYIDHCAGICGDNCEFCPDDDYSYENLPTGWDAADHKALYE